MLQRFRLRLLVLLLSSSVAVGCILSPVEDLPVSDSADGDWGAGTGGSTASSGGSPADGDESVGGLGGSAGGDGEQP